jgi:4-amino-4-deoxy-L-arabinose transferase-like glycosyltransferase
MTAANRPARAPRARRALVRSPRSLAARRHGTVPLALLLVATALLGVAWAALVPPFQGPDENDHFAYVQHLAETGSAPSSTTYSGAGSHSTEETRALDSLGLRALMGNSGARPMWGATDQRRWSDFERTLPSAARGDGDGANPIAKNPPLYYAVAGVAYDVSPSRSLFGRLFATRLVGVALLVLTVWLTWLAASELTQRTWARLLAAGVVALEPQLSFMAGIVNADILLVTIWTAFVALTLRTLKRGPTTARVLGLFVLAALSPLTHGRGIALLPPLAVVLALVWWRHRPPARSVLAWGAGGVALLGVAVVAFKLFVSGGGGSLYGDQTNYIHQGGFDPGQFIATVWQFYLPKLPGMGPRIGPDFGFRQMWIESFIGRFGWLDVGYPGRVYTLLRIGMLLLIAGVVVALAARRRQLRADWPVLVALLAIGGSLVALLHLVSYLALLGAPDPLIAGRYGLPLVVLPALAVTFVATSLPRRLGPLLAAVVLAGGVLLELAGLGITVVRFYG